MQFSLKYTRPRNSPELLLEIMHDYDEIKQAFDKASESEKEDFTKMFAQTNQLREFFDDMGSAYGAIAFLDPTEKGDFAELICTFMDR